MQPIYNELIQFWKDNGCDVPISEGTYWLDNGFIKAFTPDGAIHKLYKYKVSEDLKISITRYKDYIDGKYESWIETAERMKHYFYFWYDRPHKIEGYGAVLAC